MEGNIIALLLSSSLAVTVVTAVKELILWYINRKAEKEDKKDKVSEKLDDLDETNSKQSGDLQEISNLLKELQKDIKTNDEVTRKALRLLFGDRIHQLALSYIEKGEITFEEKQSLTHMWECYHYDLKGNGTYNDLMSQVSRLKIIP